MEDDQGPKLYVLVRMGLDVGTSGQGSPTEFLKRAPAQETILWGRLFKTQGVESKRLELINDLERLQYLYWNTTKTPPPDDLLTLQAQCASLANNLPIDTTSVTDLLSQLPEELRGLTTEEIIMGQGSATEGAIEKGGKKKTGKKAAAAAATPPAEGAPAPAAPAATKEKKVKDPNGRPGEGTSTRKVWDIADSLVLQSGTNTTPSRKTVVAACEAAGINKATAGVQYGAWFKGMNRTPAPEPVKPAEPAAAPAAAAPAATS